MVRFDSSILTVGISLVRSLVDNIDKHSLSAMAIFITASLWQYHVHEMLASLRVNKKATYATPPSSSRSFQLFLTPHYTAEILIYFAMALLGRNWTLFSALVWVVTNLSVSAGETREWAHRKFKGNEWGRWNIMPYVY
jgi:3-oxo-5-alpha-steroid 4-dehydrogenase 3